MLYKLLKHKVSPKQLFSFAIVNIIGLSIVLMGFQIYKDIKPLVSGTDSIMTDDYIVLTKKVNTVGSLFGSSGFTTKEINKIKSQSFIADAGAFETSLFNVRAAINLPNFPMNLSTDLFFEAIPEQFLDIDIEEWQYDDSNKIIPIILPKSYLDLYNFGFATSKNLPQLSEGVINNLMLDITLSSNNHFAESYKGKIVGFSKRLNTILVPKDFLDKTNKEYVQKVSKPARVIIKVEDSSNKELAAFITDNGYQIDGNQLNANKQNYVLNIIIAIVLSVGILICILSCYILILSIYLLLEKNISTLENLALLGYSRSSIAQPYRVLIIGLNIATFGIATLSVFVVRLLYLPTLRKIVDSSYTLTSGLDVSTYALALFSFILLTFISVRMVRIRIRKATKFI